MSQGARKTHQSRSRATRDKLVHALEALLAEKDFAEIGVSEIAAKAGVSSASIYRRFDKKNGFIPVLFDLYLDRLAEWSARPEAQLHVEGLSLRSALKTLAKTAWRQIEDHAHIMRAVFLHGRRHPEMLAERTKAFEASTLCGMQQLVRLYDKEINRSDADKTARMLAYYFNSILIEKGLFGDEAADFGSTLTGEDFAVEIAEFAYGYLITPEESETSDEPTDKSSN